MRVVIIIEGGVVQDVFTDEDMAYIIIDHDVQDEDEECELVDEVGVKFTAGLTEYKARANKKTCELYFDQIPAM